MNDLNLLLEILRGTNLVTPAIAGIIGVIRQGREVGKSDAEIKAESMQLAQETKAITEEDMGDQP